MDQLDLRFPLLGALLGALVGSFWHFYLRPRLPHAAAPPRDPAREAEQLRRVAGFVQQAARAMVAYSRMVDAANAGDAAGLERTFRRLKEEEAEEQLAELDVDDRAVRQAAHEFLALHAEIGAKVESRLAAGQTIQVGGELRLRAQELGKRVEALNRAAAKLRPG